jgi:hypothetical protein
MRTGQRRIGLLLTATAWIAGALPATAQQTVGLFLNDEDRTFEGYTLVSPMFSADTYLIDNGGLLINSWSGVTNSRMAYLLANGNLLQTSVVTAHSNFDLVFGGTGRIEKYDWDGNLLWNFELSNAEFLLHHDVEALPNGNVLAFAWVYKTVDEAIAEGRDPAKLTDGALMPEMIIEIEPTPPSGGVIVWEWHLWDHLIQDFDVTKDNFGVVSDHPELMDINFDTVAGDQDWIHANGIDYNPALDQIVLSGRRVNEFWVIDHSTTTAEAASHAGGNSGMGGDLLYRWGNPQAYRRGLPEDQRLFLQHDAQWIDPGRPGAGNFLVFSNGPRPAGNISSVDEVVSPVELDGSYPIQPLEPFGPDSAVWSYMSDPPEDFSSAVVSGAERLPNGNTLITHGVEGKLFEVLFDLDEVWNYVNPLEAAGPLNQGDAVTGNRVFKVRRYAPDFPGFAGRDLTPGDPIEMFNQPFAVRVGSLVASKAGGGPIQVDWDASTCTSFDYNLLYGDLAQVSNHDLIGAECGIGVSGTHVWTPGPSNLFFLVVGRDDTEIYESSWGSQSSGLERNGSNASALCGATTKLIASTCP